MKGKKQKRQTTGNWLRSWLAAQNRIVATAVVDQLLRKHRSARKKTRRYRRRSRRNSDSHERRTCSDTSEEFFCCRLKSTRGRSALVPVHSTLYQHTCSCALVMCLLPSFHVCALVTPTRRGTVHTSTVPCPRVPAWLKSRATIVHRQSLPSNVLLEELSHGGYAGVRVGEAQNPGPALHKIGSAEERSARRTRINEAGDAVPGSQDSITRIVQNLQLADTPATKFIFTDTAPPPVTQPLSRQPLCSVWYGSRSLHQKFRPRLRGAHGSEAWRSATVSRQCRAASPTRSRGLCTLCRCNRCSHCKKDTPILDITVGDVFQDRRQPGHQLAQSSPPPRSPQPVPPGDTWDDCPFPNCPTPDIVITERDKQLLADLRRAAAIVFPRCIVSIFFAAWEESNEGAIIGHLWTVLCRYRCRLLHAEIPKGSDRNAE